MIKYLKNNLLPNFKEKLGFKYYKKENLTNFVELSFTMTLVAQAILKEYRIKYQRPKMSVLDLKIIINARFNAKATLKYLNIDEGFDHLIDDYIPEHIINKCIKQKKLDLIPEI